MVTTDSLKHCARVYLAEARRRRLDTAFWHTLMRWAANARREAMPRQREMFP